MRSVRMDMSRDECRKCLRCLELDAYGNVVSVLRAQGSFTEDKKRLLEELAKVLHISNERHRAEVRRAVNDEKLSYIAEQLNGPNTWTDWAIEGRRMIPLLPRLKAHTAFTELANSLSLVLAAANEKKAPVQKNESIVNINTIVNKTDEIKKDDLPLENSTTNLPKTRGRKRKKPLIDPAPNKKFQTEACVNDNNVNCLRQSPTLPATSKVKVTENTEPLLTKECLVNSSLTTCTDTPYTYRLVTSSEENNAISNSSSVNEIPQTKTAIDKCDVKLKVDECINHDKSNDPPIIDKSEPVEKPETLANSKDSSPINSVVDSAKRVAKVVENTASLSGPGPPLVNSKVAFKKLPIDILNHQSITKVGITLNSNNTINISAFPNARLGSKTNVIVQKGSAQDVKITRGGKAAIGKVIMGSENLSLAAKTAAALLPHRLASNGDKKLNIVPIKNSSHIEIKSNSKLGSMVVLDIPQDVSQEKSMSNAPESDQNHKVNDTPDTLTSDKTVLLTNQVNSNLDNHSEFDGLENITENTKSVEPSDILQDSCQEIVMITEELVETQVLDDQTEIYNFESTDSVCEIQTEDNSEAVEIFNTVLESTEVIESFDFTDSEEHI
ncbi:uncharacterized protein LOC141528200 isoform X2 [Cotesia typhae]|uniref:uncharacterized protein LOC141528200 isoform X2 n=1 Tax=Cotesia typhae TaxID=2053667 RepID=UPI003D695188